MTKRKQSATVDLKVRMKEPLRAAIERAADRRGVSMNAEAVGRLEQSFNREGAYGGPELQQTALLMATAFAAAGRSSSNGREPSEWIKDPDFYNAAMIGVFEALMIGYPGDKTHAALMVEALKGRLVTRLLNEKDSDNG